jgi:hypothetical protein
LLVIGSLLLLTLAAFLSDATAVGALLLGLTLWLAFWLVRGAARCLNTLHLAFKQLAQPVEVPTSAVAA